MAPTSRGAPEWLYVAKTAAVVFFLFVSFATNFGQGKKKQRKSSTSPPSSGPSSGTLTRTALRLGAIGLICAGDTAETVLAYLESPELGPLQGRFVASILSAAAWASLGVRKQLFLTELTGLSVVTLAFGIPLCAISTWQAVHWDTLSTPVVAVLFATEPARLLLCLGLLVDCALRIRSQHRRTVGKDEEGEAGPLLAVVDGEESSSSSATYGAAGIASPSKRGAQDTSDDDDGSTDGSHDSDDDDDDDSEDEDDEKESKSRTTQLRKSGSWVTYLHDFKVFVPHLIPKKDVKVQACLVLCLLVIGAGRALNILGPRQLGIVTDKLFAGQVPYGDMAVYFALNLVHGDTGLGMVEALAKIPVEQFSYRQLTNAAFGHVMGLGMDFHADRDSAEVMKSIEQGEALTNLLDMAVLEILPTLLDMCVAVVFLYAKFNSAVALCMIVASFALLAIEVAASSSNVANRRRVTRAERRQARRMHQAVQGWQTVWAFNMFGHEKARFAGAVDARLAAKWTWSRRDALIRAGTDAVGPVTLFLLASLVIHEVAAGRATPGDFVFLIQYWDYLVWPMKFLAHEYRYLISDLVDAERLLDLLTTEATVLDRPGAVDLPVQQQQTGRRVAFEDVGFSYDGGRRAVADGVSVEAAPGQTIALVGATGSGKSSLMKLLMRYYDVTAGRITIDGHDIRDLTLDSLRSAVGAVPQDPLLFNTTIMDNLRYAAPLATDEAVLAACRAAAVHDKISAFPDGYATRVGESGVKLSGGEVQRLAIARAFLKDPPVLILDEATSAVDTETEAEIQAALGRLSRRRTTFVVAHRLSTVVGADLILVMDGGRVVERGGHEELLRREGRYAGLWRRQFAAAVAEEKEEQPLVKI